MLLSHETTTASNVTEALRRVQWHDARHRKMRAVVSSALRTAAVVVAAGSLIACQQSPSGSPHIASQELPASATASTSESPSAKAMSKRSRALATEPWSDGLPRRATLHIPAIGLHGQPWCRTSA